MQVDRFFGALIGRRPFADPALKGEQQAQAQLRGDETELPSELDRISPHELRRLIKTRGRIPGSNRVPRPSTRSAAREGYAESRLEAAPMTGASAMSRFLAENPFARQQLEMMLGGRIVPSMTNDRRLTVQRFAPGRFPGGGAPTPATTASGMLAGIERAGMMASTRAHRGHHGQNLHGHRGHHHAHRGGNGGLGSNMFLGALAGLGRDHGSVEGVLADPSLTVEDKITLMIMLIMKQMDKEIERQGQYINSLQQQQQSGGGGGGGAPSIDVETMKLKRLIDKRSQMFDMLRQIIDKYNETAKGIIQSIGR